jgi:ketosteroid isomerase-like protein
LSDKIFKYTTVFFAITSIILLTVIIYITKPDTDLDKIKSASKDFAFYYTNYDYTKAQDYYDNMIYLTTDQLQSDFKQQDNATNLKIMKSMEVSSSSNLEDLICTKINSNTAKAVAFLTVKTKGKGSDTRESKAVLYMLLKKVKGTWKVSTLEPY